MRFNWCSPDGFVKLERGFAKIGHCFIKTSLRFRISSVSLVNSPSGFINEVFFTIKKDCPLTKGQPSHTLTISLFHNRLHNPWISQSV